MSCISVSLLHNPSLISPEQFPVSEGCQKDKLGAKGHSQPQNDASTRVTLQRAKTQPDLHHTALGKPRGQLKV